jgi:predicted lipoprotein with Yx(FWY)xxD motif
MRKVPMMVSVAAAAGVALAACGSSGGSGGAYGAPSVASSSASSGTVSAPATVAVGTSKLGKILVDGSGRTLYLFEADKQNSSSYSGACATAWPPLTTSGAPQAGTDVAANLLGTTMRPDGRQEVTYHGHPLYYYAGDTGPGTVNGQGVNGFGAEWYVLGPTGDKIDTD